MQHFDNYEEAVSVARVSILRDSIVWETPTDFVVVSDTYIAPLDWVCAWEHDHTDEQEAYDEQPEYDEADDYESWLEGERDYDGDR